MKIVGFLQNFNGVKNGDLELCLRSMSLCTDIIYVYDDSSTEYVREIYEKFDCVVLYGDGNDFARELYHKDKLLRLVLRDHPDVDWICWFDSDAILGSFWQDRQSVGETLDDALRSGFIQLHLHNLNLWRSNAWYRTDQKYNDLYHCVWWYNTGQLHYAPSRGLHQKQYPMPYIVESGTQVKVPATRIEIPSAKLIHRGFCSDERIIQKYLTYKGQGQTGWALDRLIDEGETFELEPVDLDWYPNFFRPEMGEKPQPDLNADGRLEAEEVLYGFLK